MFVSYTSITEPTGSGQHLNHSPCTPPYIDTTKVPMIVYSLHIKTSTPISLLHAISPSAEISCFPSQFPSRHFPHKSPPNALKSKCSEANARNPSNQATQTRSRGYIQSERPPYPPSPTLYQSLIQIILVLLSTTTHPTPSQTASQP